MASVPLAPISSAVNTQTYQMWFESVGRHLNDQTTIKTKTAEASDAKVNYVQSGSITHINYTGKGGFTVVLPTKCKLTAIIPVSDGTQITIAADTKVMTLPAYANDVTVHGSYFNEA